MPTDASDLWLVPSENDRAARASVHVDALTQAATRYQAGDFAGALQAASTPLVARGRRSRATRCITRGSRSFGLMQTAEARKTFDALLDSKPQGALALSAALAAGEAAEASGDSAAAARVYAPLAADKLTVSEDVLDASRTRGAGVRRSQDRR